jgi:hypothetical protein
VLSGLRPCDPVTAAAYVDPLFNPQIGEYEVEFLVHWAQRVYMTYIQPYFDPDYEPPVQPEARKHKGGHVDMRTIARKRAPPRVNIRPYVADTRFWLFYVLSFVFLAVLRFVITVIRAIFPIP